MLDNLKAEVKTLGKPRWVPMLSYVAQLHERSTHPARHPFPYPWEEIGPGYQASPAFGHWDIIHQVLDVLPAEPEHARQQLLNNLAAQEPDGLVPGSIWLQSGEARWSKTVGHPPVWPVAVQAYCERVGNNELIAQCFHALLRQIEWFESHRKAEGIGFFYLDIINRSWESGVDEGVRFDDAPQGPYACVDATSHVFQAYSYAAKWAEILAEDNAMLVEKADELRRFIQSKLFDPETGLFHDIWSVANPQTRRFALEGMFPVVVGAASAEQANRVIDENLLSPDRFFTQHPLATVGVSDSHFELRMWRGPAWNSMAYWAARGCSLYGRDDAALKLLEAALDASALQFERSNTVWEFYHPHGGNPLELMRKYNTRQTTPCRDYLGHNPVIAMARMWGSLRASTTHD
jgi:putative isomerase